jgi:hypothetical protein
MSHSSPIAVKVRYGLLGNNVMGPHVIEGWLTVLYYRYFLENKLLLYLEDAPHAT